MAPEIVIYKFLCSNLEYSDRAFLMAYCYQNGIHPIVWLDEMGSRNRAMNADKYRRMLEIFYYFGGFRDEWTEQQNMDHAHAQFAVRCRYYAFDIVLGAVTDLNGHLRHQNVPGQEDRPPVLHPDLQPLPSPRPRNPGAVYGRYHC